MFGGSEEMKSEDSATEKENTDSVDASEGMLGVLVKLIGLFYY